MGGQQTKDSIKIGIANYSPLDFDSYINKDLVRTTNPKDDADVLYTKEPVSTNIKYQVIFNDQDFLENWGIPVGDVKSGKKVKMTNSLTDELLGEV